jgi:hypothetical protein
MERSGENCGRRCGLQRLLARPASAPGRISTATHSHSLWNSLVLSEFSNIAIRTFRDWGFWCVNEERVHRCREKSCHFHLDRHGCISHWCSLPTYFLILKTRSKTGKAMGSCVTFCTDANDNFSLMSRNSLTRIDICDHPAFQPGFSLERLFAKGRSIFVAKACRGFFRGGQR